MTLLKNSINKISQGSVLSENEMELVMSEIMSGEADSVQIAAFLTGLAERGEAISEITGAAKILRQMAASIHSPEDALDCCGTGGDGIGTYNISTAVALVAAACGVPVAKHGNRAASSKSGAADVLEHLGVNLDAPQNKLESALAELNFCFLMALKHHQAMRHVVPIRKSLGFRTIFNLLGPLANPAGTKLQLIGVYDKKWLYPLAETLKNLGTTSAWIVHGRDGLDEITTTDKTDVVILKNGAITEKTLSPEDFGVSLADPKELKGGDAVMNAAALMEILNGTKNAYRDIVLVNTSAVLNIHGTANDLQSGAQMAAHALDNGAALAVLEKYIQRMKA